MTLTATPIPRTLQFSLMAARDLSVITTPPPNRYPVETHVIRFRKKLYEMPSVMKFHAVKYFYSQSDSEYHGSCGMIQRLIPDAKIGIGHGQMEGKNWKI